MLARCYGLWPEHIIHYGDGDRDHFTRMLARILREFHFRNPAQCGVGSTFTGWYLCGLHACLNFVSLAVQDSILFNSTARWKIRAKIRLLMRLSVAN